jgi:enamine deaminase RidA (YjgF/YER057c/UK114 family)
MTRDAVTSDQLPPSGLPFSVAVRGGGLLFLSGQVAQDPAAGELADGDIAQQADQILRNITTTLAAIGKDLDDVIRVGVYLTNTSQAPTLRGPASAAPASWSSTTSAGRSSAPPSPDREYRSCCIRRRSPSAGA